MSNVITSKKYSLNFKDIVKGFTVAALTAIIAGCGQIIETWLISPSFSIDKVSIALMLKCGIGGGVSYLIKNFFTPAQSTLPVNEATLRDSNTTQ